MMKLILVAILFTVSATVAHAEDTPVADVAVG